MRTECKTGFGKLRRFPSSVCCKQFVLMGSRPNASDFMDPLYRQKSIRSASK